MNRFALYNQRPAQQRGEKHRPPTRTLIELAEEFNVPQTTLAGYMNAADAPQPSVKTRRASYYEPVAFRKWFNARKDSA